MWTRWSYGASARCSIRRYTPTKISGSGTGIQARTEATEYGEIAEVPAIGTELPLVPGMAFSVAPNAVVGNHAVSLGGTFIVGDAGPVELNPFTAQLLHA